MNYRATLLQLMVWLIRDGYEQDSSEIELIQKTLRENPEESETLRDRFAGQAMAALIPFGIDGTVDDYGPDEVARDAYLRADAMLAAREQKGEGK